MQRYIIAIALLVSTTAWADTYTIPVTKSLYRQPVGWTVSTAKDCLVISGTAVPDTNPSVVGNQPITVCGPHIPYGVDDGTYVGVAKYVTGGTSSGGGDGKLRYPGLDLLGFITGALDEPQSQTKLMFHFSNSATHSWTSYQINIGIAVGDVYFAGNDTIGYSVTNYSVKIGSFLMGGSRAPAATGQQLRAKP